MRFLAFLFLFAGLLQRGFATCPYYDDGLLTNDRCDCVANTPECFWDEGACCRFDNASCPGRYPAKSFSCSDETFAFTLTLGYCGEDTANVGDGSCDCNLNTKGCNWDGGDCAGNEPSNFNASCSGVYPLCGPSCSDPSAHDSAKLEQLEMMMGSLQAETSGIAPLTMTVADLETDLTTLTVSLATAHNGISDAEASHLNLTNFVEQINTTLGNFASREDFATLIAVHPLCEYNLSLIGNDVCNCETNNEACGYDGGDCVGFASNQFDHPCPGAFVECGPSCSDPDAYEEWRISHVEQMMGTIQTETQGIMPLTMTVSALEEDLSNLTVSLATAHNGISEAEASHMNLTDFVGQLNATLGLFAYADDLEALLVVYPLCDGDLSLLGNGQCDCDLNTESCGYDSGDCSGMDPGNANMSCAGTCPACGFSCVDPSACASARLDHVDNEIGSLSSTLNGQLMMSVSELEGDLSDLAQTLGRVYGNLTEVQASHLNLTNFTSQLEQAMSQFIISADFGSLSDFDDVVRSMFTNIIATITGENQDPDTFSTFPAIVGGEIAALNFASEANELEISALLAQTATLEDEINETNVVVSNNTVRIVALEHVEHVSPDTVAEELSELEDRLSDVEEFASNSPYKRRLSVVEGSDPCFPSAAVEDMCSDSTNWTTYECGMCFTYECDGLSVCPQGSIFHEASIFITGDGDAVDGKVYRSDATALTYTTISGVCNGATASDAECEEACATYACRGDSLYCTSNNCTTEITDENMGCRCSGKYVRDYVLAGKTQVTNYTMLTYQVYLSPSLELEVGDTPDEDDTVYSITYDLFEGVLHYTFTPTCDACVVNVAVIGQDTIYCSAHKRSGEDVMEGKCSVGDSFGFTGVAIVSVDDKPNRRLLQGDVSSGALAVLGWLDIQKVYWPEENQQYAFESSDRLEVIGFQITVVIAIIVGVVLSFGIIKWIVRGTTTVMCCPCGTVRDFARARSARAAKELVETQARAMNGDYAPVYKPPIFNPSSPKHPFKDVPLPIRNDAVSRVESYRYKPLRAPTASSVIIDGNDVEISRGDGGPRKGFYLPFKRMTAALASWLILVDGAGLANALLVDLPEAPPSPLIVTGYEVSDGVHSFTGVSGNVFLTPGTTATYAMREPGSDVDIGAYLKISSPVPTGFIPTSLEYSTFTYTPKIHGEHVCYNWLLPGGYYSSSPEHNNDVGWFQPCCGMPACTDAPGNIDPTDVFLHGLYTPSSDVADFPGVASGERVGGGSARCGCGSVQDGCLFSWTYLSYDDNDLEATVWTLGEPELNYEGVEMSIVLPNGTETSIGFHNGTTGSDSESLTFVGQFSFNMRVPDGRAACLRNGTCVLGPFTEANSYTCGVGGDVQVGVGASKRQATFDPSCFSHETPGCTDDPVIKDEIKQSGLQTAFDQSWDDDTYMRFPIKTSEGLLSFTGDGMVFTAYNAPYSEWTFTYEGDFTFTQETELSSLVPCTPEENTSPQWTGSQYAVEGYTDLITIAMCVKDSRGVGGIVEYAACSGDVPLSDSGSNFDPSKLGEGDFEDCNTKYIPYYTKGVLEPTTEPQLLNLSFATAFSDTVSGSVIVYAESPFSTGGQVRYVLENFGGIITYRNKVVNTSTVAVQAEVVDDGGSSFALGSLSPTLSTGIIIAIVVVVVVIIVVVVVVVVTRRRRNAETAMYKEM